MNNGWFIATASQIAQNKAQLLQSMTVAFEKLLADYQQISKPSIHSANGNFERSAHAVTSIVESLSDEQLYLQPWYKKYSLGRMIQLNSAKPMKNMRKRVRKFNRTAVDQ